MLFIIGACLFAGFACFQLLQDKNEYFQKYWDMWTERDLYFDESLKWKAKYYQLRQKHREDKPW